MIEFTSKMCNITVDNNITENLKLFRSIPIQKSVLIGNFNSRIFI